MRGTKLNFVIASALLSALFCAGIAQPQTGAITNKIEAKVLADLRRDRKVTFFVVLAEQADLRPAAAVKGWRDRGEAVLSSLQETAGRTQAPLLDFLARFNAEVTPFWIVNTIKVVTSNEQLIYWLAALPNVALNAGGVWFNLRTGSAQHRRRAREDAWAPRSPSSDPMARTQQAIWRKRAAVVRLAWW